MSMVTRFAAGTLVAALVTASVEAQAFQFKWPNYVTIRNNPGGQMIVYSIRAKKLTRQNRGVRFAGRCDSACTLYLSMPSKLTCIMPGASFGFHLPYGASPRGNRIAAKYMMKKYPIWVKDWIRDQRGLSRSIKTMPYTYASKHMQPCAGKRKFSI